MGEVVPMNVTTYVSLSWCIQRPSMLSRGNILGVENVVASVHCPASHLGADILGLS